MKEKRLTDLATCPHCKKQYEFEGKSLCPFCKKKIDSSEPKSDSSTLDDITDAIDDVDDIISWL